MKPKYYPLWLCGLMFLIFLVQVMAPEFTELFVLKSSRVLFEPWRLLTSIFLHGGIAHLLSNLFALGLFGTILEGVVGSKRFLWIFFGTGLIASIGAAFIYPAGLGASGAIFGVLGTLTMLRPKLVVWVSWIPMPMYIAAVVWAITDVLGVFDPAGKIANVAHLAGLASGLVIGWKMRARFTEQGERKGAVPVSEQKIEEWERRVFKK